MTHGTGGFQRDQRSDEFMSVDEIDAQRQYLDLGQVDLSLLSIIPFRNIVF